MCFRPVSPKMTSYLLILLEKISWANELFERQESENPVGERARDLVRDNSDHDHGLVANNWSVDGTQRISNRFETFYTW